MKKSFFYLSVVSVMFIFTSCSTPQEPVVLKSSIDKIDGWGISYNSLSENKAHSGKLSSKIDSVNQYSLGFDDYLKNMKSDGITKIRFSAYILIETVPSSVTLVGVIGDGTNKPISWVGVAVKDKIQKPNEWTRIEGEVIVPENCADNIKFNTYLYSCNKEVAYVDDFEIIVE